MPVEHSLAQRVSRALLFAALVARAASARRRGSDGQARAVEAVDRRRSRVRARQGGCAVGEAHRRASRAARLPSASFPARRSRRATRRANSSRCATAPRTSRSARRSSGRRRSSSSTWSRLPWLAPEDKDLAALAGEAVAEQARGRDRARGRRAARVRRAGSSRAGDDRQGAALAGGFGRHEGPAGIDAAPHRSLREPRARAAGDGRRRCAGRACARARSTRRRGRSRRSPPRGSTRSASSR